MIYYLLGILTGIILCVIFILMIIFFRVEIEKRVTVIEKIIQSAGPKPKGSVIMPISEEELSRQRVIEKNKKLGKDTTIDELRS